MKLYCANKRYSSWSLRAWLALKQFGIPFSEEIIFLRQPKTHAQIDRIVQGARLPILEDGSLRIWESMAIFEYLAEKFPAKKMWPANRADRALARSYSNEMHAGFTGLRTTCPMNCFAKPMKAVPIEARQDVERILDIWRSCLSKRRKGGFLFGAFSLADAMYTPVAVRLSTYDFPIDPASQLYIQRLLGLPSVRQWFSEAAAETTRIEAYEVR